MIIVQRFEMNRSHFCPSIQRETKKIYGLEIIERELVDKLLGFRPI